ncbi:MAG TPA: alkaline phosphatase family protein [Chitinophagaceae bacterium]|nr:alkaline phosphatase family protein [Chitinophagaceae bacterium]
MKSLLTCFIILFSFQFTSRPLKTETVKKSISPAANIFIITLDGFRWQEIFTGADPALINDEKYTPDTATMKMLYWCPDAEGRRKKLLPFFWNVIAAKGQLYGNRNYNNKVSTSNVYSISYPGYNEIFTGNTDITISSNSKIRNPNINILEWLNSKETYKGKVAAFTSWDVFPYILNEERSQVVLNSGYENMDDENNGHQRLINEVQQNAVYNKTKTRHDLLTFLTAKEYIAAHHPKVVFLGLGETDEAGHNERYDTYLEKAAEADKIIAQLWHYVQTTPGYKDNTTFIITTDHGRGKRPGNWSDHGMFINASSQTWMAVMGPGIFPAGEIKEDQQLYQKQLAQTIAELLGEEFITDQPVASAISFKEQQ